MIKISMNTMANGINLFTIGFTQKTAEQFFETLRTAGVKRIIDTRLNNVSQLAGFAKQKDLIYFLKAIADIEYLHILELAPTKDILDAYKKKQIPWQEYEQKFKDLITQREIETSISGKLLENGCLLCSEAQPHHCHRRLVAEYLQAKLDIAITIHHL